MKKTALFTLLLVLCASFAAAEETGTTVGATLSSWLKSLQHKMSQILPKKSTPTTTSVAGVRGAKEEAGAKLYWKGKKGEEPVTEEEMTKFRACLDLAEKGDRDAALKQLEDFMKVYPDSALIPDAKKTFDIVKAEPKVEVVKVELKPEENNAAEKAEQNPLEKEEDQEQQQ